MPRPIAYKTGTIQPPNTAKQNNVLVGVGNSNWGAGSANATFYNSLDSSYQYVIVKNSAVPAMWSTGDFTTGSLLTIINGLPERVNQTRFTEFPFYSQAISPQNQSSLGASFRANITDASIASNTFKVSSDDYDPEDLTAISTSYEVMDLNDMKNRTKPTVGASLLSLKNTQPLDSQIYFDVGMRDDIHSHAAWDLFKSLFELGESPLYNQGCLLYTSPSPRDRQKSRMPSSA